MKSLVAAIVAIAMVAGAFVVRDRMDDEDGSGAIASGPLRVICSTELAELCGPDDVVQPAPETAARLIAATQSDVDVWLAAGPWPQLVDGARKRANRPLFFGSIDDSVARSPLVAVLVKQKANELRGTCGRAITWRCLGDAAGQQRLRVGALPATEGAGVLVVAAALAGYLDNPDFAINDVTDAANDWLDGLSRSFDAARAGQATDYQRFLVARGTADAFLVSAAEAGTVPPAFERVELSPVAAVDVAIGARTTKARGEVLERARAQLLKSGWTPSGQTPNGLPSPGVLEALLGQLR